MPRSFSFPGVLEAPEQEDQEAFQKAKTLYRSCMNESESPLLRGSCCPFGCLHILADTSD